jgi:hypothetical protein
MVVKSEVKRLGGPSDMLDREDQDRLELKDSGAPGFEWRASITDGPLRERFLFGSKMTSRDLQGADADPSPPRKKDFPSNY